MISDLGLTGGLAVLFVLAVILCLVLGFRLADVLDENARLQADMRDTDMAYELQSAELARAVRDRASAEAWYRSMKAERDQVCAEFINGGIEEPAADRAGEQP